jgi:hypothetical protein
MTQKADDIYTDSDELEGILEDARMACPVIRGELVIEWLRDWRAWHERNDSEAA